MLPPRVRTLPRDAYLATTRRMLAKTKRRPVISVGTGGSGGPAGEGAAA